MSSTQDTVPARVDARGWGWRHAGRRRWAVRDLELTIEPGERVLLLGASGAGKSTLLAGLAGVLGGDEEGESRGELLLNGSLASGQRGVAGLVLQDPDSQTIMARIGDDVAFGCENLGVPREEIWQRARAALAAVGLELPLDHPSSALSGGQRQRLALAGVLAMRPGLLLLDEPTANLDAEGVEQVRDTVARVAEQTGATLIVVEHRVSVWLPVVDRVIVIDEHGVVADGPPGEVMDRHGAELFRRGIWVPGHAWPVPARAVGGAAAGGELLTMADLVIGHRAGAPMTIGDGVVAAGAVTALTGPNGSGKTTLALTLAGLMRPLGGTVRAAEALAAGAGPDPFRWRSRQLLSRIGFVFQDPEHQFLATSVRRELAVGPRALGLPAAEVTRIVDSLLERLQLAALAEANPFTLSGGEQRRLSVATVLASSPRVLILDEPTFGQDSRTWRELVLLLAEQRDEGRAVLAVTHDTALVDALADARIELRAAPEVAREPV